MTCHLVNALYPRETFVIEFLIPPYNVTRVGFITNKHKLYKTRMQNPQSQCINNILRLGFPYKGGIWNFSRPMQYLKTIVCCLNICLNNLHVRLCFVHAIQDDHLCNIGNPQ